MTMPEIFQLDDLGVEERYRLLADTFVPRPVCIISTRRQDGTPHWAFFSFVSAVGANPATVIFCPSANADGSDKVTLQNAEASGCFVANFISREVLERSLVVNSPQGQEWVPACSSQGVRLSNAPVQMECDVLEVLRLASGPSASILVVGRVRTLHRVGGSFVGKLPGAEYLDLESGQIFTINAS